MIASTAERFKFDTVFSADGEIVRAPQRTRPKTSFTPDEVEAIRQEAFAQGSQNADAAANAALAQSLHNSASLTLELLRRHDAALDVIRAEASQLAAAIARRVAGHALAHYPMAEISHAVAEALHRFHTESRLIIRVPPALCGPLQARLPQLIDAEGFAGRAMVAGDPALHGADSRIEWQDGGIDRNTDRIFERIETEIARWHAADSANANPDTTQPE